MRAAPLEPWRCAGGEGVREGARCAGVGMSYCVGAMDEKDHHIHIIEY